jgi:hypothetical protein
MLSLHNVEVDVNQVNELRIATDLAVQHNVAALVVHPSLAGQADLIRAGRNGRHKIIVPVDWPKGESLGLLKFRGLPWRALQTDGFEIMLTPGRTKDQIADEASSLSEFVRDRIGPLVETRFVLQAFSQPLDETIKACEALAQVRNPSFIRIDQHTKSQTSKTNPNALKSLAASIQRVCGIPLKLSGNFASCKSVADCGWAPRIGISVLQLESITKEPQKFSNEIRELLS